MERGGSVRGSGLRRYRAIERRRLRRRQPRRQRHDLAGGVHVRPGSDPLLLLGPRRQKGNFSVRSPAEARGPATRVDGAGRRQVARRTRPALLLYPACGRAGEEPADGALRAWRSVGPRHLGLQFLRAMVRQPRLRLPAGELSRLHRVWEKVPERRKTNNGASRCTTI